MSAKLLARVVALSFSMIVFRDVCSLHGSPRFPFCLSFFARSLLAYHFPPACLGTHAVGGCSRMQALPERDNGLEQVSSAHAAVSHAPVHIYRVF